MVGTDGVVYGPVDLPTLFQWAAQGRLVPTSVLIDRLGRQLPASAAPELQNAFPIQPQYYAPPAAYGPPPKSRRTALWLAFLLGFCGAHRFYLGHTWTGVAMLLLNVAVLGFLSNVEVMLALALAAFLWPIVDMAMIASGNLREANGRELG